MNSLFILSGIVVRGKSRGKGLGFPTINFPLTEKIPEGIYISQTEIQGKLYESLTFIGAAKTYNETTLQAETYLFDFARNVYGETTHITLLKKIRDNKKFHSEQELITQMEDDKKQAEIYFKKAQT